MYGEKKLKNTKKYVLEHDTRKQATAYNKNDT